MNKIIIMLALVLATCTTYSCKEKAVVKEESQEGHNHGTDTTLKEYICLTDCEKGKTYAVAGKCVVCGKDLIEVTAEDDHEGHDHAGAAFICPMDCEKGKTYHEMGKCPVCKMDLIIKEHTDHDGHDHHDGDGHDHKEGDGHEHK